MSYYISNYPSVTAVSHYCCTTMATGGRGQYRQNQNINSPSVDMVRARKQSCRPRCRTLLLGVPFLSPSEAVNRPCKPCAERASCGGGVGVNERVGAVQPTTGWFSLHHGVHTNLQAQRERVAHALFCRPAPSAGNTATPSQEREHARCHTRHLRYPSNCFLFFGPRPVWF